MPNNATLSFGLSESDVNAMASNTKKVTVSSNTVIKTRSSQFVAWNCPFDECKTEAGASAPLGE